MRNTRGITLIALIISIVIMITLAVVTVTTALNGGLFEYAGKATEETEKQAIREQIQAELTGYYIEKYVNNKELTIEEFLIASFGNNVTAFTNDYEGDYEGLTSSLLYFNYKGTNKYYGFSIDKNTLEITTLDEPVKVFELVTNTTGLDIGEQYIIVSAPVSITGFTNKFVYVLDKVNEVSEGPVNRKNKAYEVDDINPNQPQTIIYSGDYALTLNKKGEEYTFYDSENKKYLNVTSAAVNYLGINKDEDDIYSKFSISFNSDSSVNIVFSGKDTHNTIQNNNWFTSCYTSGKKSVYLYKEVGTSEPERLSTCVVEATAGDGEVTLSWNEIEDATSYSVLIKSELGTEQLIKNITDCTVTVGDLSNGYKYYYQVKAYDETSNKESIWSLAKMIMPIGEGDYEIVTTIEANQKYLMIVYDEENNIYYTIGDQKTNNRGSVSCEQISDASEYALTITEGSNGGYLIYDEGNGYLTATNSTSSNRLKTVSVADDWSEFSIEIDASTGNATITCLGKDSRNVLKFNYNSGAPIFACYASDFSTNYSIQFYKYNED